ncbi:kinase-like domain-containing protein [Syncephalis fuscata]|nr:kinase-like domain-containing protein [Syncephalis fuscata]
MSAIMLLAGLRCLVGELKIVKSLLLVLADNAYGKQFLYFKSDWHAASLFYNISKPSNYYIYKYWIINFIWLLIFNLVNNHSVSQHGAIQHADTCFIKISERKNKIDRRYTLTDKYVGHFSRVRLGFDLKKRNAAKDISIENEIDVLKAVKSDRHFVNLIKGICTFYKVYSVLDYLQGDNLTSYLGHRYPLSVDDLKHIFKQSFEDIKPNNILLWNNIKLPDVAYTNFDMAQFIRPSMTHVLCGTMPYMAPEVLLSSSIGVNIPAAARAEKDQVIYNHLTSPPLNIRGWSLGVILYEALISFYPYDYQNGYFGYIKDIFQTPLNFGPPGQIDDESS